MYEIKTEEVKEILPDGVKSTGRFNIIVEFSEKTSIKEMERVHVGVLEGLKNTHPDSKIIFTFRFSLRGNGKPTIFYVIRKIDIREFFMFPDKVPTENKVENFPVIFGVVVPYITYLN